MLWSTVILQRLADTLDFKVYSIEIMYNNREHAYYAHMLTEKQPNQYYVNDFYLGDYFTDAKAALINLADYRSNP